jgi:hypothetical protein
MYNSCKGFLSFYLYMLPVSGKLVVVNSMLPAKGSRVVARIKPKDKLNSNNDSSTLPEPRSNILLCGISMGITLKQ